MCLYVSNALQGAVHLHYSHCIVMDLAVAVYFLDGMINSEQVSSGNGRRERSLEMVAAWYTMQLFFLAVRLHQPQRKLPHIAEPVLYRIALVIGVLAQVNVYLLRLAGLAGGDSFYPDGMGKEGLNAKEQHYRKQDFFHY